MTPRQKIAALNICKHPSEANDDRFSRLSGKIGTTLTLNIDGLSKFWHASATNQGRPLGELDEDEIEQLKLECKRLLVGVPSEGEKWDPGEISLHLFRPVVTRPEDKN